MHFLQLQANFQTAQNNVCPAGTQQEVTFPAHTDPNVPTLHVFIPLAFGIKAKC
jgi:hypothetical protein